MYYNKEKGREKTMAKKTRVETGVEQKPQEVKKVAATEKMTSVTFRTRLVQKKKAEKIFEDMGISTSAALNMFLAQVVRDKGMPFLPSTVKKGGVASAKEEDRGGDSNAGFIALEELWDEL